MFKNNRVNKALLGVGTTLVVFLIALFVIKAENPFRASFLTPIIAGILIELYNLRIKKTYFSLDNIFGMTWAGWVILAIIYQFV